MNAATIRLAAIGLSSLLTAVLIAADVVDRIRRPRPDSWPARSP